MPVTYYIGNYLIKRESERYIMINNIVANQTCPKTQ